MDNQHRIIKGYRELSAADIALMNEVKEAGVKLEELFAKVEQHIEKQYNDAWAAFDQNAESEADSNLEVIRLNRAEPYDWHQRAKVEVQTAIMKLVRSIAQPTTF
jgi:translation initiation factor 2 alpha subunit (eIF-2alpha)